MNPATKQRYYLVASVIAVCVAAAMFVMRFSRSGADDAQQSKTSSGEANQAETGYSRWRAPELSENLDPDGDEWESEALHARIAAWLGQVQAYLNDPTTRLLEGDLADFQTKEFRCPPLRPKELKTVFDDQLIRVRRASQSVASDEPTTATLADALRGLLKPENDSADHLLSSDARFKVIEVRLSAQDVVSRVLVEISQRSSDHIGSINTTWDCSWQFAGGDALPRISNIALVDYEDVAVRSADPLLEDVTAAVLDTTGLHGEHLLRGIDHWCSRLTHIDDMRMHGHHGLAVADVNGDGLEDLYACDAGGLPNRLYLQQPDGTALDYSKQSHADWLESSAAALFVDFDNDGDQDLAVTTVAGLLLASNDGAGHFTPRAAHAGTREAHSICAADYDNDGDVDLYLCIYGSSDTPGGQVGFEADVPIPYSDANNGGANVLLRNDGDFQFVDASEECGLGQNNRRWSFSAAWEDFDRDGDMDLYVANDFGRNNLYRNNGGKFEDVAAALGVEDRAGGMSAAWADFNRDGWQDLYIGNMFSAAGRRVTYQRQFLQTRTDTNAKDIQRMARGNTLFLSNRAESFRDATQPAGVAMGRWSWGSKPVDLNNDGFEDLVVVNGYFTNAKPDDL